MTFKGHLGSLEMSSASFTYSGTKPLTISGTDFLRVRSGVLPGTEPTPITDVSQWLDFSLASSINGP